MPFKEMCAVLTDLYLSKTYQSMIYLKYPLVELYDITSICWGASGADACVYLTFTLTVALRGCIPCILINKTVLKRRSIKERWKPDMVEARMPSDNDFKKGPKSFIFNYVFKILFSPSPERVQNLLAFYELRIYQYKTVVQH